MKFTPPPTVERLGIVYTPVEVVDFILQSVNDVLKKNFNRTLSDKKVHVLDPFTGTGTFITRLIQSGLIRQKDLLRKYQNELHANEIVLLAYYIAAINIENTFHDALASFQLSAFSFQKNSSSLQAASCKLTPFFPFDGICFTDTFEMFERDEKLARIKNLRTVLSDEFETYLPLAPDKKFNAAAQSFFVVNSRGLTTARDAWAYNFSRNELAKNIQLTIDTYNVNREKYFSYDQKYVFDFDSKKISWSGTLIDKAESNFIMTFDDSKIFLSMYRPFSKSNLYFDDGLNERRGQMPKIFPTGKEKNLLICVPGIGNSKNFSVLITNSVADYQTNFNCQCFPLYWYEVGAQGNLFGGDNYERRDAVTKEDIFYYVYGFLHLPSYREKFSAELKKSLPRIFLIEEAQKFWWQLVKAGRELAEIHLNYETQEPTADVEVIGGGDYRVKKKCALPKTTKRL